MTALPNGDRTEIWSQMMRDASKAMDGLPLLKVDLRAAVDAADDWADSMAANYNQALPQTARQALTARQKAQLLMYVIRRRYEIA